MKPLQPQLHKDWYLLARHTIYNDHVIKLEVLPTSFSYAFEDIHMAEHFQTLEALKGNLYHIFHLEMPI